MKCLMCGRRKTVQRVDEHRFRCTHCGCLFDDDPEEGGSYHDTDPGRRMTRDEDRRDHKRTRLGRR